MRIILHTRVHTVIAIKEVISDLLLGKRTNFAVSLIPALTGGQTILGWMVSELILLRR